MLYRTRQSKLEPDKVRIKIGDQLVDYSPTMVSLGVKWEEHLNWGPHIEDVVTKCRRGTAALARLKHIGTPKNICLQTYRALVEPIFLYCIQLYGNTSQALLNRLQVAQNNAIRAFTGTPVRMSTRTEFKKLKLKNINQLYLDALGRLAYKNFNGFLVPEMELRFNPPLRSGRLASAIYIPTCQLDIRHRSTDLALGRLWLDIPKEAKESGSHRKFLSYLEDYITIKSSE